MGVFDAIGLDTHEEVLFGYDRVSGLRSIIAIHSTSLGPALGGTRFFAYPDEESALVDVLRLSKGMSYKSAAAGLDLGGGKAVIIGDPGEIKTERLLRAYGDVVDSLGGRYITAEDVGTTTADMAMIRRQTRWVAGLPLEDGGSGDPSPATARGVVAAMRAVADRLWGSVDLYGRTVAVQGVGKVGSDLVARLAGLGADIVVADVNPLATDSVAMEHRVKVVELDDIYEVECDIFAPCAMGGSLDADTIPRLSCAAVVGSANNQLAEVDRRRPPGRPGNPVRPRLRGQRRGHHRHRLELRRLPARRGRRGRRADRDHGRHHSGRGATARHQPAPGRRGSRRGAHGRGRPAPPRVSLREATMLEIDNVRDHRALGLSDERAIEMYRAMLLARRVDERMWTLNRQGGCRSSSPPPATRRCRWGPPSPSSSGRTGRCPTTGTSPSTWPPVSPRRDIFLSVFSKAGDPASGGRQMPNHWSEPDANIFTHSSVIATQFPHACGIAYRLKHLGQGGVVMVSSGEGATSEGDWHEAMNFAGIHQLPMIFLVENNLYAISVPVTMEVAGSIAARAAGYAMPGIEVDGNDILAVYGVMAAAVQRARDGDGPTLVEAMTYRYYAHTSDDDDKLYRSAEEVDLWRRKDPITRFRQYLVESRLLDEATETAIDTEITEYVSSAAKDAATEPDPTDPYAHVYARADRAGHRGDRPGAGGAGRRRST